jgi:hypothetical protein
MVKVGRNAQLMVGEESTYGTLVTPDRSYEFRTEGLQRSINRIESQAIRKGTRLLRSDRWAPGQEITEGSITAEIAYQSFGLWLKHALGAVSIAETVTGEVYEHTYTLGALEQHSLTAQVGLDDIPKTYSGIVINEWTLQTGVDEYATLDLSLSGREEDLSEPLAAVNYPDPMTLLPFTHASLDIAGSEILVNQATISGNNQMTTGRHRLGSPLPRRPVEDNYREITGNINADFDSLAQYNRYVNGEEAQLVLAWVGPEIGTTGENYELRATLNVRSDGQTPTVGGFEEIRQEPSFKVVDPTDGSPDVELLYRTSDSAP